MCINILITATEKSVYVSVYENCITFKPVSNINTHKYYSVSVLHSSQK